MKPLSQNLSFFSQTKKSFLLLGLILAMLFSGCTASLIDALREAVAQGTEVAYGVESTLNDAMDEVAANSENWQSILQEAMDKIPDSERKVKEDLQNLIDRGISHAGVEIKCTMAYMRDMLLQGLRIIKAEYLNEEVPAVYPVACTASPASVDMNLAPNDRNVVYVYGYNFDVPGMKLFHIKDGHRYDKSSLLPTTRSPFELVINLGFNGIILSKESEAIELEYNGQLVKHIPVIQEYPPFCVAPWDWYDEISTTKVIPALKKGDREFKGHGPCVEATARIYPVEDGKKLNVLIMVEAYECPDKLGWVTGDRSYAYASIDRIVFTAKEGERIKEIKSPTFAKLEYIDFDIYPERVPDAGLVGTWYIHGDTEGDDIGETYVEINFNPIQLLIESTEECITEEDLENMTDNQQLSIRTAERILEIKPELRTIFQQRPFYQKLEHK